MVERDDCQCSTMFVLTLNYRMFKINGFDIFMHFLILEHLSGIFFYSTSIRNLSAQGVAIVIGTSTLKKIECQTIQDELFGMLNPRHA